MPGWQSFFARQDPATFALVSIAVDHNGKDQVRPFVEAAAATFPTVVDEQGTTTTAFGFKAVPNGVLVDSNGTVRYGKYGGFSVERPDDLAAVERFAAGGEPGPSPADKSLYRLGATERELVEAKLRLGHLLEALGRRDEAVAEWRDALRVDPENLTIRKQIWAALHPEKFHPTIDWAWQKTQIAEERAAEVAAGICGPDGCPIRAGSGR